MNKNPDTADGLPVMSEEEVEALERNAGGINLDCYAPSYKQKCEVCGNKPVVKGIIDGRIAYDGTMCGPCTWGEAESEDPSNWN